MNTDTPKLPLTLPDGAPLPPPPAAEWREHTASRFRTTDPEGYAFVVYLVRELGVTNKSELVRVLDEHRAARHLPGVSRNTIIGLMNDTTEFKAGEIDQIIQRRAQLTSADALDRIEALLDKARAAKDLGAAAMALTAVYNVKQLSSGNATRINGNTQDSHKARAFDDFRALAAKKLEQQHPRPPMPAVQEAVVIESEGGNEGQATHSGGERPNSADRGGGQKTMNTDATTSAPKVGSGAVVRPGERFDLGFLPSNIEPTHFICRDCGETFSMEWECGIPNGQAGVYVGKEWCIVRCFCKRCVDARYAGTLR